MVRVRKIDRKEGEGKRESGGWLGCGLEFQLIKRGRWSADWVLCIGERKQHSLTIH